MKVALFKKARMVIFDRGKVIIHYPPFYFQSGTTWHAGIHKKTRPATTLCHPCALIVHLTAYDEG
ncbi:MAG: hypothetical protein DA408_07560 [Bacteroidetes bacterium]|nr:MAG: hypothetical protein C7N36_15175 [Bacteroidota bacterium]PTM13241.1 MAG: hypothetical protein DA408_07560 [Bacteroidota bacterium]